MAQIRQRLDARQKGAAQHPVLDDVAERLGAELAMVVMEEARRVAVGDADLADRLGLAGDLRPQPDAGKDALRAEGDRRGAPVECLADRSRRILAVDDSDVESGAGAGRRQAEPDEPAADDDQLASQLGGMGHRGRMGRLRWAVQSAPPTLRIRAIRADGWLVSAVISGSTHGCPV